MKKAIEAIEAILRGGDVHNETNPLGEARETVVEICDAVVDNAAGLSEALEDEEWFENERRIEILDRFTTEVDAIRSSLTTPPEWDWE